ncbi:hypothetical protein TNCT_686031 [Trichonephila clavata]|uniref:Uncharacterized protein n=1 Tax=Trichonephila clavata TaxID=2740835 RepID=A0A8X6J3P8_TRICU|nr:hypothetical protein TNCT_686031 [Trichonephila clavata]
MLQRKSFTGSSLFRSLRIKSAPLHRQAQNKQKNVPTRFRTWDLPRVRRCDNHTPWVRVCSSLSVNGSSQLELRKFSVRFL